MTAKLEAFKKAGIYLSYDECATFPQVPYVQDVLYVLQLSDDKDKNGYYGPHAANWPTYIENLMLVAAAVTDPVFYAEQYECDEAALRKTIAQAIVDLCPSEAKCLFNSAVAEAYEALMGQSAPSKTADRESILQACGCSSCKGILRDRQRGHDSYFDHV